MKPLLFAAFSSLTFIVTSTINPTSKVDIKQYTFQLELNDTTDNIAGKADIMLAVNESTNIVDLELMNVNAQGKGMKVDKIMMNGISQNFTHQQDHINITLTTKQAAAKSFTLTILYHGIPADGLIIGTNMYGDRTFFGDNWPNRAHCWLPTMDHPSDKASVDFIVIAPKHYEVIGNGIKVEESELNPKQKLTHWKEEANIPTKVMVIGAARFAIQYAGEVDQIPVEHWVYPQNRLEGFHDYAAASRILDFFNSHIGPYPYQKLANVQSKTRYGGMENASNIFYSENSVNGKADHDNLIAHEIAHQWFGNSASEKEWSHVWLSEGFATYFTHLYNEYTYGEERRRVDMKKERDEVISYFVKSPMPVVNNAYGDLMELLNTNSYQKGSWVLHMLRTEIGNDNFWKGIRQYYNQYKHGNALTADLQSIMEEGSGKNLEVFFQQWIYKAGHPVLKNTWNYDASAKKLQITIDQTQKGSVFKFPLEIGILVEGTDNILIQNVKIAEGTQKFSFSVPGKPVNVILDPHVNLLFDGN